MDHAATSSRKSIRPHRKSRAGCSVCKRRKCDERKPCSNCISFGTTCDLAPETRLESLRHDAVAGPAARRGRGRPRKTWIASQNASVAGSPSTAAASSSPSAAATDIVEAAPINADHAELLAYFITTTAETLAGDGSVMRAFWTRNALHVGLSHPFVLHLILASAAYHIAYLARKAAIDDSGILRPRGRCDYLSAAQRHLAAGLASFSAQLSCVRPENCGALYLAAVLTSYCTFAAGPTSRNDLLVCTADGDGDGGDCAEDSGAAVGNNNNNNSNNASGWMPFVYGVRLMRQSFSPDVLFAGAMAPLGPDPSVDAPQLTLNRPVYARDGFPRLEWEAALDGLRAFLVVSDAAGCLEALDDLIGIYAATYGRRVPGQEVSYDGPLENQFVFGWLYRTGSDFIARVRRREPPALLVLAHYAVLLGGDAVRDEWFIEGWAMHMVTRVNELLAHNQSVAGWMRWPTEQVDPTLPNLRQAKEPSSINPNELPGKDCLMDLGRGDPITGHPNNRT
ncbi:hypothetical protein OQA88_10794 [Cercophora sp. LCS_1]